MSVNTTAQARKWERTLNNIKYFTFWTLSILIVGGFSYFYYSYLMRPVAGSLFFLGGAVIVYYYYIKWFLLKPRDDPDFKSGDQTCPDYLTLIPPGDLYQERDGGYFCVDFVGVSQNGRLMATSPKNLARDIKKPTHRFKVTPSVDLNPPSGNKLRAQAAFMQRVKNAGLSWNSLSGSSIPSRVINRNGAPVFTGGSGIDFTIDIKGLGNSLLAGAGCLTSNDDNDGVAPPSWTTAAGAGGGGPAPGALMSASASMAAPAGPAAPMSGGTFTISGATFIKMFKETIAYLKEHNITMGGEATPAQKQQILTNLISKRLIPAGTTYDQLEAAGQAAQKSLTPAQLAEIQAIGMAALAAQPGGIQGALQREAAQRGNM
jgi:hypothetical protein